MKRDAVRMRIRTSMIIIIKLNRKVKGKEHEKGYVLWML